VNTPKLLRAAVRTDRRVTITTKDGKTIGPAMVGDVSMGWVALRTDTRWMRIQVKKIDIVLYE
jgi:hypothetical protein